MTTWRERWAAADLPAEAVPARRDFGARYPWRAVIMHAHSRTMQRRIDSALRWIDQASKMEIPGGWRLSLSGGKDSTAMALLFAEHGWTPPAISVKDDLDFPGEAAYTRALCARAGISLDVLTPRISLRAFMKDNRLSLVHPTHDRAAELSAQHFYGLLEEDRVQRGSSGEIMGLRSEESRVRKINAAIRGTLYQKVSGTWVLNPVTDWLSMDIHAYVHRKGWMLLPTYFCVDPGMEWDRMRKSWFIAGGDPARLHGHYTWLKRWWPEQYRIACDIDPEVALISGG